MTFWEWSGLLCLASFLAPFVAYMIGRLFQYGRECGKRAFDSGNGKKNSYSWRKD